MKQIEVSRQIKALLETKKLSELKDILNTQTAHDLAEIIDDAGARDDIILFRLLYRKLAKETYQLLSPYKQKSLLKELTQRESKLAQLLDDLSPDDRTALFGELPGEMTQDLLALMHPKKRKVAAKLLGYPKESIGRLMTPDFVFVRPEFTIAETLEHIRQRGSDSETLNVIYVVNSELKLIDDLRTREILLSRPETKISELMDNDFIALYPTDDQEDAIAQFKKYDRTALPVINSAGILIGIVTIDDVMDVAENEATEDFHKFASIQHAVLNPMKAKTFFLYKKRIAWLFILVFINIFSGAALSNYESTISSVVSLVFFLPLLIGSGGNAGSQSATLMVRALATGDVKIRDWLKLIFKEACVALLLGLTMAIGAAAIASFRAPEVLGVVSITMVLVVLIGSLIGMSLPFAFTKFGLDPAAASAPLITSILDILGIVIYFSVATMLLV